MSGEAFINGSVLDATAVLSARYASNFFLQYHCLIKHLGNENKTTDHQRSAC